MSTNIKDHDHITQLIQLYIEGAAGDVAKLKEAFHPEARMFGHIGAMTHAIPISQFFELVASVAGKACGQNYQARILSIHVEADAGMAVLIEQDYLGADFIDYFSVAKLENRWWIVNKTYAVTSGK